MEKELQKIKEEWNWLYKNGKLDEEAVLREIDDYDFILKEVGKVYYEGSKRKFLVKGNKLILEKEPIKAGQLWVYFIPTKEWKKKNKKLRPAIATDLVVGQKEYLLPTNFSKMGRVVGIRIKNKI